MAKFKNTVWDSTASAYVAWLSDDDYDASGASYPGPGTYGVDTSQYRRGEIYDAVIASATVSDGDIDNAKMADMTQATVKGRASGAGTGAPVDLSSAQATAILDEFTDSLPGAVPASGGGTTNFLRADATWAPGGGGGAHDLGGATHNADTLANLNSKVSDATLDDSTASRPPSGAASGDLGGTYPSPTVNDGADSTAIHDNVAAEISAITPKGVPTNSDYMVIEDAADFDNKKSITIGDLPSAAHIASTSNPHTVTAAQVGNTTAQWNADQLQGDDIDATIAPTDGQVLTWDNGSTHWTASSPDEGTAYMELGENHTLTSAGGSPDTEVFGGGIFDASLHNAVTFRAAISSTFATTGTSEVKLYDDGSTSTPDTPRLVATLSQTSDASTYEVFTQALTIVAATPGTNEILSEGRVYRVVVENTATSGDTTEVRTCGFIATGNADVVTVSADYVQAIVMSLNA